VLQERDEKKDLKRVFVRTSTRAGIRSLDCEGFLVGVVPKVKTPVCGGLFKRAGDKGRGGDRQELRRDREGTAEGNTHHLYRGEG